MNSLRPRTPSFSGTSLASSQQHILADHDMQLEPPSPRFASRPVSGAISLSPSETSAITSLSAHFVPSKFSGPASPGPYKRKNAKGASDAPKQGGGREAFRTGEARMPGEQDADYDGVDNFFGKNGSKPKLRWNRFKWTLFSMNLIVTIYSLVSLIFCLLTWFNVWHHADIVRVGNRPELVVSTLAASVGVITSLIGWAGILLNNRGFLAAYTLMLWGMFAILCVPGYLTYKKRTFNLEGKVNAQWSRGLGVEGRLRIQSQLSCCGYYSPFMEASVSQTCYSRSLLPGCKGPYIKFERRVLGRWYAVAFGLVPFQLLAILTALLCSNHVTYRFGKGMMPKAYRLSLNSMAVIMDSFANQLTERYGADSTELVARSRSAVQPDSRSNSPLSSAPGYSAPPDADRGGHAQYASLGGSATDDFGQRT